eukprot:CAMPEP_0172439720 /NCGR_PEP_ID=MMETSP1065-20121228/610_1 /TAXON_ID=265537 /ORGANISM="Amphiprora paludosa, Strain CCMP125" /LENGTH=353 /DNA_ID=CAMNT_0013188441 /DNA_START=62 /DNA_END=1123 /DNA_ORIENTATION=+
MISRISLLLAILLLVSPGPVVVQAKKKKKKTPQPKPNVMPKHLQLCAGKPPLKPKKDAAKLSWLLEASGDASLTFPSSPQHQAACWILYDDVKQSSSRSKYLFLQRYALATLHISTTKSNTTIWDWPLAADEPSTLVTRGHWGSAQHHECTWYGVHCNFQKKVERLDLGFLKLDGLLVREVSLLTYLKDVDLHANDFQGVLPNKMLDSLTNLEALRLHMNGFFGALPNEIESMEKLQELYLFGNYLSGAIPTVLGDLKQLTALDLYANNFAGRIPSHLGKLKKLTHLDLRDNDLTGPMPKEICKLPKLKTLVADCLGPRAEVQCDCCTICCKGQMDGSYDRKCVDMKSGKEIR